MNFQVLIHLAHFFMFIINQISSISIVVNNIEVLENPDEYNVNRLLDVFFINNGIEVNNSEPIFDPIDSCYICILVDAIECHCFQETYVDITLLRSFIFPKSCIDRILTKKFYWFNIKLTLDTTLDHVLPSRVIMTVPLYIENKNENLHKNIITDNVCMNKMNSKSDLLTLILPLTIDDFSRSLILFESLKLIPINTVLELLIFVPDNDLYLLQVPIMAIMNGNHCINSIISSSSSSCYNFTTTIYSEQVLFQRLYNTYKYTTYPYALQMAIKLLASKLIQTSYYITLDADIILLHSFTLDQIIVNSNNDLLVSNNKLFQKRKALYHYESRSVHENWWIGSENLIGINTRNSFVYFQQRNKHNNDDNNHHNNDNLDQGFGVTPAILSTFGSLLTISTICNHLISITTSNREYHYEHEGTHYNNINYLYCNCISYIVNQ